MPKFTLPKIFYEMAEFFESFGSFGGGVAPGSQQVGLAGNSIIIPVPDMAERYEEFGNVLDHGNENQGGESRMEIYFSDSGLRLFLGFSQQGLVMNCREGRAVPFALGIGNVLGNCNGNLGNLVITRIAAVPSNLFGGITGFYGF